MEVFFSEVIANFHQVHTEIEQTLEKLPEEALDWQPGREMNTISVLVVHLAGSERFLLGDVIKGEPSNRDREAEFRAAGLGRQALVKRLHDADTYMTSLVGSLEIKDLGDLRVHPRHGNQVSVAWALLHALEHASVHLGHIQMTVQLWEQRKGAG